LLTYLLKRISLIIPFLIGVSLIAFIIIHLAPGEPTALQAEMNPKVSAEARAQIRKIYGLDKPLHIQYIKWLQKMLTLDFGRSLNDDRPVRKKIGERIPITLTINVLSLILIFLIAIPLGVLSAVKQYSFFDKITTLLVFIGFAIPTFWLALLLMRLFGLTLGWLPISGINSLYFEKLSTGEFLIDRGKHLVLPVFCSAFGGLAYLSRYARGNMLEVIRQDYIRTARAKGLSERVVIFKHALKNTLMPIITLIGLSIPGLIGGSVIFETIFTIPGIGRLFWEAVMTRDYPLVMGIFVVGCLLTQVGILISDVAYAYVDPRIRYK
jgi:peptide/nickel transport system permease protein